MKDKQDEEKSGKLTPSPKKEEKKEPFTGRDGERRKGVDSMVMVWGAILVVGSCSMVRSRSQMPCRLVVVVEYHSMMMKNRSSLRIGMVMGKSKFRKMMAFHLKLVAMVNYRNLVGKCKLATWYKPVLEFHKMRISHMMVVEMLNCKKLVGKL
ncbi:hypothetical protein Cgig2_016100 [Carnegiea gigantea]|uniref:Uncharacterized protein n=1 Tax=Carnegiea gigantea TaxID=171969 RepID=A0A9Q1QNQ4_9CARY|nr:hypothetical protein Cgig2_016100 [Carnegiea gigantea]